MSWTEASELSRDPTPSGRGLTGTDWEWVGGGGGSGGWCEGGLPSPDAPWLELRSCEAEQEGGNNGLRPQRGCWLPEPGWGQLGSGRSLTAKDCRKQVPAQETSKINTV